MRNLVAIIPMLVLTGACTAEYRAWMTARAWVRALQHADSAALARLAGSGSAHNGLCAARLWPAELTGRDTVLPEVRRVEPQPGDSAWHFRAYGVPLAPDTSRARYSFSVLRRDPTHVWTNGPMDGSVPRYHEFWACIGWPLLPRHPSDRGDSVRRR